MADNHPVYALATVYVSCFIWFWMICSFFSLLFKNVSRLAKKFCLLRASESHSCQNCPRCQKNYMTAWPILDDKVTWPLWENVHLCACLMCKSLWHQKACALFFFSLSWVFVSLRSSSAFEESLLYLVSSPDALFHRQFTDAESRLALFHGSRALGSLSLHKCPIIWLQLEWNLICFPSVTMWSLI